MRVPSFTDYLPGRVYRSDQSIKFPPVLSQPDHYWDMHVEQTGMVKGIPYRLRLLVDANTDTPGMISATARLWASFGKFIDDSMEPRDVRSTPSLARAWVEFGYLVAPLSVWHITPCLETVFGAPLSRERSYRKPVKFDDLLAHSKRAGWTTREDRFGTRLYERDFKVPLGSDAPESAAPSLDQLLMDLPPIFGDRPRLFLENYPIKSESPPREDLYMGLVLHDHTLDCLRGLEEPCRSLLTLRYGLDENITLSEREIEAMLQTSSIGSIRELERDALEQMRRAAAAYARRPFR
jgi:hypothetical protein